MKCEKCNKEFNLKQKHFMNCIDNNFVLLQLTRKEIIEVLCLSISKYKIKGEKNEL